MNQTDYDALVAAGFSRIPITRTLLADTETPLSTFSKLCQTPYSFLFESVEGGEKWSRYSIVGLPATERIAVRGNTISRYRGSELVDTRESTDPLADIEALHESTTSAPLSSLPVFHGGWVGYFSYDTVRYVESKLSQSANPDDLETPDILLVLAEEVVVFDNLRGTLTLIVNADALASGAFEKANQRLDELEQSLSEPAAALGSFELGSTDTSEIESRITFGTDQTTFESWVKRIKDYILDGDVMQVVVSQRMTLPFSASPLNLYRALRHLNPSPYLFYLDLEDFHVVGSSPEILVRSEQGKITVRPIAGTIRRGADEAEDRELAERLLNDEKERAEHLMLIDLGRNDIGRVSQPGSVALTDKMVIEKYSHVMHIVSNVTGDARESTTAIDSLRATLPAGTLSGAPKVRAMEIIDELEPVKRGVYGGAVGYLSWSGDMDTAIAIRTAVVKDGQLIVQAGAGVVADSVPESEWEETLNKARAVLRAAAMVEAG
ncbi:MAG: anthranilate synthase component I [Halieaceae bacterium]